MLYIFPKHCCAQRVYNSKTVSKEKSMIQFRKYKQFSRLVQEVVVVKVLKRYDTNKTNHNLRFNQVINSRLKKLLANYFQMVENYLKTISSSVCHTQNKITLSCCNMQVIESRKETIKVKWTIILSAGMYCSLPRQMVGKSSL